MNLIKYIVKKMVGNKKQINEDLLNLYSIDWKRFKDFIIYHDLAPFAYFSLKDFDSLLPQDLNNFLKNNYYCALVRCQDLWQEFLRISIAFQQAQITLLPIKGIALLYDIYAQKPLRPMTDIDLLVKEENLKKAEEIFYDLGYRKELYGLKEEYWRKNQCHITFYKKEKEMPLVELHWSLDFKRKGNSILPELWDRIREINGDGNTIRVLSPEDTLFSLALHNRRFGRTLCLKNAHDAVLLLNKYSSSFDWGYVLDQSRKYNICSTVFFALFQAKLLSDINIPNFLWRKLGLPIWKQRLVQYFIEKNTFLPKQSNKSKSLYLKSHFLLYDSLWEPIDYIINIPEEQFTKYYNLNPYDKKMTLLYRNRLFYIPFKILLSLFNIDRQRAEIDNSYSV